MCATASGRTEVDDLSFRRHGHLRFEGVGALLDALEPFLVFGSSYSFRSWRLTLLDLRLPSGLLGAVNDHVRQFGEHLQKFVQ